eukprot:CAMPEP_0185199474 /NCGR_PEP_ID=MMETSP1140-20130426/45199_1 /TAXON_ID=298111 /ORGANISM="Pavlova sp., Strain CCMP459" /LENGTH=50 /DNA_ID=CAMNT_0027766751 /DNA_START=99 /DNA_END=248 /DNA_ORIENTATION=+
MNLSVAPGLVLSHLRAATSAEVQPPMKTTTVRGTWSSPRAGGPPPPPRVV